MDYIQGIGERITHEENERRRLFASPEGMAQWDSLNVKSVQGGPGEMITPAQAAYRKRAASPEWMAAYDNLNKPVINPPTSKPPASTVPLRDPFGSRSAKERGPIAPKEGTYRNGQREIYKNGRWQPVNVIHAGQKAQINGRWVTADGRGNWRDAKDPGKYNHATGEFDYPTYGTYSETNRTPPKPAGPTPVDMTSLTAGAQDLRAGRVPDVPVKPTNGGDDGAVREETTRRNINGVEQRGTVLSPMAGANQMLENLGVTTQRYGKFQSNNLPGSTYSPEVEEALSKIYDTETLHRFDGSVNDLELSEDLFMDGSGVKGDGPFYAADVNYDEINPINMLQAEGSPFLVRNGGFSATDQVNPKNKNGTRARYDQEFLNSGNDVIGGLRAADRSKGLLYASGKYWRENPNAGQEGEKDYFEIKKDEYKAIKNSDMGAQDFLSSKLEQTKQTFKPDLTDQSDAVRDAVGLTADPYTFTAEGPSDERSTRLGEYMLGKIDDINPKPTL